jgi:acyl dehydratase
MTPYREEVRDLRGDYAPIHIDVAVVERAQSFKFIGVHITKEL